MGVSGIERTLLPTKEQHMSFIHDRVATVTFIGDYFTLTTQVDAPSDHLLLETEEIVVAQALDFLKGYYGFDLAKAWTDYTVEISDAQ